MEIINVQTLNSPVPAGTADSRVPARDFAGNVQRIITILAVILVSFGAFAPAVEAQTSRAGKVTTGGYCLRLRQKPTTNSTSLLCIPDGKWIKPKCYVRGQTVWSYMYHFNTALWHKVAYGGKTGYISDGYFLTGTNGPIPGEPKCGSTTTTTTTTSGFNRNRSIAWPVRGTFQVSATWGGNQHHLTPAVDIAVPTGTPIYSVGNGVVTSVRTNSGYNCNPGQVGWRFDNCPWNARGNYVTVKHADGRTSMYMHLKGVSVSKGQKVKLGQKLGTSGNSGFSTGPHLHYEEWTGSCDGTNLWQCTRRDPGVFTRCINGKRGSNLDASHIHLMWVRNDGYGCY